MFIDNLFNRINKDKILDELYLIDKSKWYDISSKLNHFEFPKELNNIRPKEWKRLNRSKHQQEFSRFIMNHIQIVLGNRYILRQHNLINKYIVEEKDFDEWYKKSHTDIIYTREYANKLK